MWWCAILVLLAIAKQEVVSAQDEGSPCRIKTNNSNGQGKCRLLDQCTSVYNDLVAGKRPQSVCGYHNNLPVVCCPESTSGVAQTPTTPSGPVWGVGSTSTPKTFKWDPKVKRSKQMCHEYAKSVYAMVQPPVLAAGDRQLVNVSLCAIKSKKLIIGGTKAEAKEFPHMAAIGYDQGNSISWNCGGTLISDLWVLTAAHCTYSFQWGYAEYVRVGDLNLESTSDDARPQERRVARRVRHPSFKRPSQYHDIALLRMDSPVTFDAYVRPACLSLDASVRPNEKTVVSGWGIGDWFDEKGTPDLMKTTLPILSYQNCSGFFANEGSKLPNGVDSKTQLCAGQVGKDTCQGDSGGPLMVYNKAEECMYDIVGITSFGKLCGSVTPGIYTKVQAYVDWIEQNVWP